jgi:hypothetical protein
MLGQRLTPKVQSFSYPLLGLDANQAKLIIEIPFPLCQIVIFSIKDHSISGGPNDPACRNDNLSENEVTERYPR